MDVMHVLEFLHHLSKIFRLPIPTKHSIVHHAQGATSEINEHLSLSSTVLKLDNIETTCFVRPEINIGLNNKSHETPDPHVYYPIFGSSI
jgi:hypothetical protein